MSLQVQETYSYKWLNFGNRTSHFSRQKAWFLERYGWTHESLKQFVKDKTVLDAGCGMGWFARWMVELGAKKVVAVDFSNSVKLIPKTKRLTIVQADICSYDFKEKFDWINCDQVIHHVPDPFRVFKRLVQQLKCGGIITIYVYKKKFWLREFVDKFVRKITVHSHTLCLAVSMFLTGLGFLFTRINLKFQRMIYWNVVKCFWNDKLGWYISLSGNYDWYRPEYAYHYSPDEFLGWFQGMKVISLDNSNSGISIRAMSAGDVST